MNQFDKIDNPERNEMRKEIINQQIIRPEPFYNYFSANKDSFTDEDRKAAREYDRKIWARVRAEQEQEVVDKREIIEKFAKMIKDYKLAGLEIEKFAEENDIPGVCCWDGVREWVDNDIIGDAIQWAHSDHSC